MDGRRMTRYVGRLRSDVLAFEAHLLGSFLSQFQIHHQLQALPGTALKRKRQESEEEDHDGTDQDQVGRVYRLSFPELQRAMLPPIGYQWVLPTLRKTHHEK